MELDKGSMTCNNRVPDIPVDEKPLILVVHDECTFYSNCDQSYFWGDEQTSVLRQKSLGCINNGLRLCR